MPLPTLRRALAVLPLLGILALSSSGIGADGPDVWWSFQPVRRVAVPRTNAARNPIDAFLDRRLASEGLSPALEADARTLIRRLTFDLTGLPPTPDEVDDFVSAAARHRETAIEAAVERLLASPRYGERQARFWLDLVRYAETHGYERDDPKPDAWRYRDWVVRAFNDDMPYDRFLTEQLAGDEIANAGIGSKTATGWYRLGLIDDEPADLVMDRFDQLDDIIKVIGSSFLGVTLHCARCHDHKFDPLTQKDYYRLLAFFEPAERYKRGDDATLSVDLASESEQRRVAELTAAVEKQVSALRNQLSKETDADVKKDLEKRIKIAAAQRPNPLPMVLGLTDSGPKSGPTRLLTRGDAHNPGAEVQPGFLSIIDPETPTIKPAPNAGTTGRRLALARWITRPDHPLTARVMVNRIWQRHFGRGIVATPSDFGAMGEGPDHPELLDWLAGEFIARGWSIKAMHRLIVKSAAYQRSGAWNDEAGRLDPENRLLWRQAPRRLEAEAIRDTTLAVAGVLNLEMGGPSVRPPIEKAILAGQSRPGSGWKVSTGRDVFRRGLYVHVKRTLPLPELELLDAANPDEPCPRRNVTTTAPQALTLLNGAFWNEQAAAFADRLRREAGPDPTRRIDRAFRLAFHRLPTRNERRDALSFLQNHARLVEHRAEPRERANPEREALRAFCLVLLNANELVTLD